MDTLALSRLQFAVTAMFHFLFVPLTLGLGCMVALGAFFILFSALGVFLWRKDLLGKYPLFLKVIFFAIPLPYPALLPSRLDPADPGRA